MKSPNHIAIIMDGSGRWGVKKYNSRLTGHKYGVKNIKSIINFCLKKEIKNLTLFALSSDNLAKRKKKEIHNLFNLLEKYLGENIKYFVEKKIQIKFIGEKKNLSKKLIKTLSSYSNITNKRDKKLLINIAFNYSAKQEIINSLKKIIKTKKKLDKKNVDKHLYTSPISDPEILIRTGGYSRLSDFLLWQCSYSEIFFLKKLWPEFKAADLNNIINKFRRLKRNFGS